MNQLINFPVDLSRTAAALEGVFLHLSRIADALERLAPVPQIPTSDPYIAGLSDLRRTDPQTVEKVKAELGQFAWNIDAVVGSERFLASIMEYERQVAEVYGREAISELPWNKAAGGNIFQREGTPAKEARAKEGDPEPSPSPAP
jgi:hypothetical protein